MVRFVKSKKNVLNIGIVLDRSSSMYPYRQAAIDAVNAQLESFRKEAKRTGIKTRLTIQTFASQVDAASVVNLPIQDSTDLDHESYFPAGNTALRDAMSDMMARLPSTGNNMALMLVVTDGEENVSKRTSREQLYHQIQSQLATDRYTFVMCVPPGKKAGTVLETGIPEGCVTEWEGSKAGLERLTKSVTRGVEQTYTSYNAGATMSCNFFATPDVNNLNPTLLQTNLDEVTGQYGVYTIHTEGQISEKVVCVAKKPYRVGIAFYELTKRELVKNYKDIIMLDNKTQRLYTGDGIRSLLRLPEGVDIKLTPASSTDYTIFVKSTSWNRKLKSGSRLLVAR